MLQGTFETLSLPEVLGLLASARKTGALWLEAGSITGIVHLQDGHGHAVESGDLRDPVEHASALLPRLVDLCFAVMCQESGSFRFAADDPAPWLCAEPVELGEVLVEVDRLLKQWREILRVIPSLECRPQLLDALQVEELVIDRERWALLVAMDGRRTVRDLVQRTNRPMIELCQSLLELIDAGAIGVIDPAAAYPETVVAAEVTTPAAALPEIVEPAASPPETEWPDAAPVAPAPPVVVPEAPAEVAPAAAEVVPEAPAEVAPAAAPAVVLTIVPDGADTASGTVAAPEPVPEAPAEPVPAEQVAPEPVAVGSDAPDKGAFLRLFSGLRDS